MKQIFITLLRVALLILAVGVLAICLFLLPVLWNDIHNAYPDYAWAVYVVLLAMYVATIPYLIGVASAWRVLSLIKRGLAFSKASTKAVGTIALSAASISLIYIASMPFFYVWGDKDDAPGLIVIGMVLVGTPLVIATCAALLKLLVNEAVELKSENDLTV